MSIGRWYPKQDLGRDAGLRSWYVIRENGHRYERLTQYGRNRDRRFATRESAQRAADGQNAALTTTPESN